MTTKACVSLVCYLSLHLMFIMAEFITFLCVPKLLLALLCLCLVFAVSTMRPLPTRKRKSSAQAGEKHEIIKKIEAGWTTLSLSRTYGVLTNTLYDHKNMERIMQHQDQNFPS